LHSAGVFFKDHTTQQFKGNRLKAHSVTKPPAAKVPFPRSTTQVFPKDQSPKISSHPSSERLTETAYRKAPGIRASSSLQSGIYSGRESTNAKCYRLIFM